MSAYVGVDVGGTKAAAVLVDEDGVVLARDWFEHGGVAATPLPEIVLGSVRRVVAGASLAAEDVAAYGVAVAGLVSSDGSTLVHAAKLRVRHLDLGAALRRSLGRPVRVENDANATLYGHRHGSSAPVVTGAAATDVVLLITLGTGTGGAILSGGRPVVGAHGFAAELGHVLVDPTDRRRCLCGVPGCLENYASGRGVDELAALDPAPSATRERLGLGPDAVLGSREVVALAGQGDAWAVGLLELAGRMLGRALTVLCVTLDPSEVIVSGSFGHAAQRWLLPAAATEMVARWPFPTERAVPALAVDAIGPFAAATGAALLSRTLDAVTQTTEASA